MTEQTQFLEGLESDSNKTIDVLDQSLETTTTETSEKKEEGEEVTTTTETTDDDEDEEGLKPRNRRERRLIKKLQDERESAMFLAGKLEARTEATKAVTEESDYLKSLERIYGTDSPEAQLATDLLKKAITGAREDARQQAVEEIRNERAREREEVQAANQELDSVVEDLEDTYGITMTQAHQKSYFQLLYKMSPKDENGDVVGYADPHAVWEIFQDKIQRRGTDTQAKNLSARSMVQSGASKESTLNDDSQLRFLKENGII